MLTTGFDKDEVFVVGTEKCTLPEMMIFLTNIQKTYENVFGEEIWNLSSDGLTFEDSVKNTALARLAQIKTMYLMAISRGISLDGRETENVKKATEEYWSSLTEEEILALGITEDTVENLYMQIALAQKAYEEIIKDISPEISDDEARYVKVRIIYMRTAYRNGDSLIPYADAEFARVYNTLLDIRNGLTSGELDFETEAARYNEAGESVISFGKGTMDPKLEDEAFSLASGDISRIIETADGLYLMQCISTLDRSQTDANKILITEKLRDEAFESVYDEYLESLIRNLNTELWNSIELSSDPAIRTSNFFDICDKYFSEEGTDGKA